MPTSVVTLSSQTASQAIPVNLRRFKSGVGLLATVSSGASLTYSVQVTGDDIKASSYVASSGNWNEHDTIASQTSSANGNLLFPVTAIRLNVSTWTSGTVTLAVIEAET